MFVDRITIFCFAASYAVALALEASRLMFRSGVRGAVMLAFGGAGLLAHTMYLYSRAARAEATPLSTAFDWYLLAAWVLAITYLYLTFYHPHTAIGLFVLPLVLGLIGAANYADDTTFPETPASQAWGAVHGVFLLLGTVAVLFGFAVGIMYLVQSNRLKRKLPATQGLRLPSLEWLAKANSRAIILSVLLIGIGFASGVILNLINQHRQLDELPWSDPVIWRSLVTFAWLVAAAVFNALYKPARLGRKVAYLTVANFAFLAVTLGATLFGESEHGVPKRERGADAQPADRPEAGR